MNTDDWRFLATIGAVLGLLGLCAIGGILYRLGTGAIT